MIERCVMRNHEVASGDIDPLEDQACAETPEVIAALEEAIRDADENPGCSYTFEELMVRVTGCSTEPL